MENKALFLGVICCLQMGVWSQIVSSEDATVSVPKDNIEVKVGDEVPLECYGSNPSLSYYIKNRAVWQFTDSSGASINLTSSFYPTVAKQKEFEEGIYKLDYRTVPGQNVFLFNVSKKAVTHADNGVYTCSLIGEQLDQDGNKKEVVMSKKSVNVVVLNPVENIKLEIKGVANAMSMGPIVDGDKPVEMRPGQYEVICSADGSNPAPIMSLMYNQNQPYIVPEYSNMTENNQVKHMAKFHVMVDFATRMEKQTLTCQAKLPNEQYPTKQAGMSLMVSVDKPDIKCANTSVRSGDKQRFLSCNITTEHGISSLTCAKVSWRLPKFGVEISSVGDLNKRRFSTEDKNTYEAECMVQGNVMQTKLIIYEVKPVHFSMLYEVMYDEHAVETTLYEIVSAAHILLPSLLTMVAVAFISRLLSKTS